MKPTTLMNFGVSLSKKEEYTDACAFLGLSVSQVCRSALEETVSLAARMKNKEVPHADP